MVEFRKDFSRIKKIVNIPNLIEIQRHSYEKFLQMDLEPDKRLNIGLQGAFQTVFPIKDFSGKCSLEFVSYKIGEVKYDVKECIQKGLTYAAPLKIVVRLVVFDTDRGNEPKAIRDIKEQEIYFGEIPLMTESGTFVVNGTERVIVSQLHRSPGIFFDHDKGKTHAGGRLLYSARIIPIRGSWLDLEFDPKDLIYVRIDRRRKMPVTILLKAMGNTPEQLLQYFYDIETVTLDGDKLYVAADNALNGEKAPEDIKDTGGEVIVKKGRKITKASLKRMSEVGIKRVRIDAEFVSGKILAGDVLDPETGEILHRCNTELTMEAFGALRQKGIKELRFIHLEEDGANTSIRDTLVIDSVQNEEDAIMEIYRRLRPSNPPTPETARRFFQSLFFDAETYDLSDVGRVKMNYKLRLDVDANITILRNDDVLSAVKYLINLKNGSPDCSIDDIDHLGNRRVRSVGELIENQYRVGLVRMERAIKEKMNIQDVETMMPHDLVNAKPVSAVVNEFFGSSQLSQFMDQTNPLSEVTHKRRLSALGPGGLTRERAGFEVRDVHPTHYGRICPVETPEGPNIGLIVSLSTYARVNEFGFIETPYRVVDNGRVTNEIRYLTAIEEEKYIIGQANAPIDAKGRFTEALVSSRKGGDFVAVVPSEVDLMDVSPNQLVSVAAGLIPFLEHDDANRALMGSNMQRQAVPLLRPESPLVGTGMEAVVARDSGAVIIARRSGVVENVDASRIVVKCDSDEKADGFDTGVDIYSLTKYQRSNQDTCFNHKPIVGTGERVSRGQVIADGPATDNGELALGRNVMVAFMSWGGYNYEDSILVSERVVKDDIYTSVHIEEFETMARDTKLGKEEITRDIPNVGEEALKNLDESGIVRMGVAVKPGDILVGKITPKGETQLSPEEKLLRAIFGEKAGDVRDTSLRVPPGVEGVVIDTKIFTRKGAEKDRRSQSIEQEEIQDLLKDKDDEIRIIQESVQKKIADMLAGEISASKVLDPKKKRIVLKKGDKITRDILNSLPFSAWNNISLSRESKEEKVKAIFENLEKRIDLIESYFAEKIERLKAGDELPPGVIKMVKVYIAIKRKLSVGDKMAGRHGNKGVLSRILPEEDMPFFEDGTPVDIILNPLGVPSRMNVGQILETHLGWAAKGLGERIGNLYESGYSIEAVKKEMKKMYGSKEFEAYLEEASDDDIRRLVGRLKKGIPLATPVFDGAHEAEIRDMLKSADLPQYGQALLFDGRTGEPFDREITVGMIYMLKLHHLVDNKIHARSIGPYSLVTQQPLGGKAQFGGQRLGEMEVWAMEAYGAAYSLQEFLTVKSDDVAGRTRIYEAIVKGEHTLEPGLPESFNVLVKELQSLGLDVELVEKE